MDYIKLGSTDLEVSRICFGTLWIGGVEENNAIASINRAIDLGVNFIDTAEGYGEGRAEKTVARAIAGKRDKCVIATKCGLYWGQFAGKVPQPTENHINMMGQRSEDRFRNSHPAYIELAIEGSLQRLGTDYIDLYQIHYPDSSVPWEDTIGALQKAQTAGKIRYFGVSNFTQQQTQAWLRKGPMHSLQPLYNMFEREIEQDLLPFCREHNIAVLPYSSLAHGLLTGKFHEDWHFGEGDFRGQTRVFKGDNFKRNLAVVEKLKEMAAAKGVTMAQLALAWVITQPGVASALAAAKSPAQVEDNVRAIECDLDHADMARVEQILAGGPPAAPT